jgi:hypothetical protein
MNEYAHPLGPMQVVRTQVSGVLRGLGFDFLEFDIMSRLSTIALAAPIALAAGLAAAAPLEPVVFDFGQLADDLKRDAGGHEAEWADTIYGQAGWTVGGITVRASDRAHLDGGFTSRGFTSAPSGLGYCDIDDCNRSDQDGIREAVDRLVVTFDRVLDIVWTIRETTQEWRDGERADHTLADGCARVNGTDRDLSGGSFVESLGAADVWTFEACDPASSYGLSDYYVTGATVPGAPPAPIPVPAGAVLLGTALAGLGLGSLRRKG